MSAGGMSGRWREGLTVAVGITWLVTTAPAGAMTLVDLVWDRKGPDSFVGRVTSESPRPVKVRIAIRADPMRYKSDLAFYRLASALGSEMVPRTEVLPMRLGDLLQALDKDAAGVEVVRLEATIRNDATVMVTAADVVPEFREVRTAANGEVKLWRSWAYGSAEIPSGRSGLVGGYVEMLVLDYLAGNVTRTAVAVEKSSGALRLLDNRGAFQEHPHPPALDIGLSSLKRVVRFPRRMMEMLRSFDRPAAEALLRQGTFAEWLVAARPLAEMMERRRSILSLVDARIAEAGEAVTLSLP